MRNRILWMIMLMMALMCHQVLVAQNSPMIQAIPSGPVCIGDQVTLSVSCPDDGSLIFSEGFSDITTGNDNNTSGSSRKYQCDLPTFPNCDNEHIFLAGGHLRFGDMSSGGGGYITSAPMDLSAGPFMVKLWLRGWNNLLEHPEYYLLIDADTVQNHVAIPPLPFNAPYMEFTYTSTTAATSQSTITIGNSDVHQRFFLDSVAVVYVTPTQYLWSTGETTSTITVTPDQVGNSTYAVTVSNSSVCSGNDDITIEVIDCDDHCNPWILVTDVSDLTIGSEIVIAAKDYDYALSTTQNNNNRGTAPITRAGNAVTFGNDVQIITLENGAVSNTFAFNVGSGYLYAASSNNNHLKMQNNINNNASWYITLGTDSAASIVAQGDNTRNTIRYNSSSSLFSCYASGQQDVVIYKRHPLTTQSETTVTACSSYYWNGSIYDQSVTDTIILTNDAGCDSMAILHLTINHAVNISFTKDTCGSYTWNGVTYNESGEYTQTLTAANGCDSVVTLHLTITEPPEVNITVSAENICIGDSVLLQATVASTSTLPSIQVPPIAVGDILCTDGSIEKPSSWPAAGKTARGIVFYVDNTGEHGWAVHLQDQAQMIKWCPSNPNIDIPSLTNTTTLQGALNDFDGYGHTHRIRSAGTPATYPAAYAVDFNQGWYIPSIGQLNVLYADYPKVNESLQTVGGTHLFLNTYSYWSSSEFSDYAAWDLVFYGFIHPEGKAGDSCLRSVRSF